MARTHQLQGSSVSRQRAPDRVSTGATERSAHHKFPFRRTPISSRSMSYPGLAFLRVHQDQIAEAEVEVHEGGRGLVLLCRVMASDAPRRRSIHAAHNRAWTGC